MNTSQIKTFAINSRQILKQGVINKISSLGFNPQGEPVFGLPQKIQGATVYAGKILDESFFDAWMALKHRIEVKGIKDVYEEAAYTWFNRLVAIRIMQKNGYIEPVLQYSSEETRIPRIVAEARAGHIVTDMTASDRAKLDELLNDDSKTTEQFTLLIENFCKYNPVIFNCFGGIEKYISILLPDNILAQGGFIDLLNHTTYITDEDYSKSELIGWLYQFYISEKKDEVFDSFKKGKKAEAEDIPAATQIFTPNWIVKYMVQNTIGRIYLDNNPYSELGSEMKYLVGEKTPDEAILHLDDLTDYKMIDPACGSGHILVEAFDLFYSMYREEGYSSRQAVENILRKNIIGIDLDTRAKQLATFALLMKAVKADESFLDCEVLPRVLDMPRPFEYPGLMKEFLAHYGISGNKEVEECSDAFVLLKQANNLGSIMDFCLSSQTRYAIEKQTEYWDSQKIKPEYIQEALDSMKIILAMTDKYSTLVANPPYMGSGSFNAGLSDYVKRNYPRSKADLFAVFMDVATNHLEKNGKFGMINMHSWMFLSSFEELRHDIIDNYTIDTILHLGPRTFDELNGEVVQNVAFVVSNSDTKSKNGTYFRLVDGKNCGDKERIYLEALHNNTENVYYAGIEQNIFENIPGSPIAYWASQKMIDAFSKGIRLSALGQTTKGIITGDNKEFLRLWQEISASKIEFGVQSVEESITRQNSWFPCNKGGSARKWYGNNEWVINWENDGENVFRNAEEKGRHAQNYYSHLKFKPCISWSSVSSTKPMFRYKSNDLVEHAGMAYFCNKLENSLKNVAFLNSAVTTKILELVSPTLNLNAGDVDVIPYLSTIDGIDLIEELAQSNIEVSKLDWDSHETSWDFKTNELIALKDEVFLSINGEKQNIPTLLTEVLEDYKSKWSRLFYQLHSNEEELNRQFIEIYGLQNELTPDVPLDEITILQQGEISIENNEIVWHDDVIIKQLISYAVGCWMGRYRLDKPGLHIAHPNPSSEEVCTYQYNGHDFAIDDDGIIPMMSCDSMFEDNGYNRIVEFIKVAFGEDNFTENLNFIEKALGKSLEDYMMKDFWKDHKKMYQNRPIYWLFSSKKGAFQCMVYMHRMNPYTAERVRTKYLLKHIDDLKGRIATASERAALLTTVERRNLAKMQKDLDECLEYHDVLHEVADQQIGFDLDDGVVVNYAKFGDVLAKIK